MNAPIAAELGAVRFSLSRETDDDDIDRALTAIGEIVGRLREARPAASRPKAAQRGEAAYA